MEDLGEDKLLKAIKHYQDSINKYSGTEHHSKILHAISKLERMPITVEHLKETGIGKTINSLRKNDGGIGNASRALIKKWKKMVVEEEGTAEQHNGDTSDSNNEDSKNHSKNEDSENSDNEVKNEKNHKKHKHDKYDKKHRHSDSSKHKKHEKNSSHSSSHSSEKQKREDKDKHKEKRREEDKKRKHKEEKESSSKKKRYDTSEERSSHNSDEEIEYKEEKKKSHKSEKHDKDRSKKEQNHKEKEYKNSEKEQKNLEKEHKTPEKEHKTPEKEHKTPEKEHRTSEKNRNSEKENKVKEPRSSEKEDRNSEKHKEKSEVKKSKSDNKTDNKSSTKNSDSKNSDKNTDKNKENKSSHKSREDKKKEKCDKNSSNSKSRSDSSSSKSSRNETPTMKKKKEVKFEEGGIDCGSGASFAEALGMMEPIPTIRTSPAKKKTSSTSSPVPSTSKSSNKTPKKESTEKESTNSSAPTLLSSNVKLEPLDINISAVLPEITTNYKPLPNNFQNFQELDPAFMFAGVKSNMTEEEALEVVITSKTQRTKVYSGNKTWKYVPSLFNLCVKVLQDNIDSLEYTGGVPYSILKPVLERATADQLFNAENHNPYLVEETDELWVLHCKKTFKGKTPHELESWRDMYLRCCDEREAKLRSLTQTIKLSQDKSLPVRQTKLAYVDSVVKPPRGIARKQAKFGTSSGTKPLVTPTSRLNAVAAPKTNNAISVPNPVHRVSSRPGGIIKPKKAPLMQKALAAIKSSFRR